MIVRFLIELAWLVRPGLVNGRVKTLRRKFPALDHEFPRPFDRFLLEIITEAPIAQHLEKGVVISVEPDVFEVVMFPPCADAFLRVDHARRLPGRLLLAEKNGHELIHAGVGEKEIWRIRHERRRGHSRVLLFAKEIEKTLTNLSTGHDARIKRDI